MSLVIVRFKPDEVEIAYSSSQSSSSENLAQSLELLPPIRAIALSPPSPAVRSGPTTKSPFQTKQSPSVPTLRSSIILSIEPSERAQSSEDLSSSTETIISTGMTSNEHKDVTLSSRVSTTTTTLLGTTSNTKRTTRTYHPTTTESGSELSDPFSPSSFYTSPSSPSLSSPTTESQET